MMFNLTLFLKVKLNLYMNTTRANGQRRVVITGIGTVSPLGLSIDESWKNAINGVSGIGAITKFDASKFDVRFAGEVKNFNCDNVVDKKDQKKMDLFIQYAMSCAKMAMDSSGYKVTEETAPRTAVFRRPAHGRWRRAPCLRMSSAQA